MKFKTFIDEATRKPEHTHAVTRGGNVISYHTSSKSAHKKADSLDNQYGSTVHSVKLLESAISEMIPYALSAANANAEHERARRAKKEEERRKAKEQLDRDSEDNSNPFASMKSVKESHVKVGQRVKFNEPVSGTARHTRKPMSFDGGKVVQVTPTGAMVRPQAWHGDEGLDVHVPHKNIKKEAIVEGGNYGKPYNNDEDLNSKSNTELQRLHDFWKTRIERDPNHNRAKGQLTKIKAILAGKIGNKMKEEVEHKVGDKVAIHAPDDWDWHEREGKLVSTSDDGHVVKLDGGIMLSVAKHQIKKIDEEVELDEAYDVNTHAEKIHKRVTNPRNLDRINTFAEIKKAYTAGRGKRGLPLFHSDVKRIPGYSLVDSNANGKSPNVSRIARGLLAAHNAGKKSMKEEVEQIEEAPRDDDRSYTKCQECKKGKYVEKDIYGAHLKCTNCGDVVNRYERDDHPKEPGPSIPEVIAKNNKYEKALAALKKKHGISEEIKLDGEMNNRITKIHVRGQNVIVHRYDTEAKGTYKEVKHHSSATAAQTYARQLHKARGSNAELIIKEAKDKGEYDYEGDMAMSQLKSVIANAQKLHDMLKPDTNLPEWVQSKITLAEDYIVTATNYMDGELNEGLVSAIKRAFTPKPKSTEDQIANFRAQTKARTQQNLGDAAKRKPKPYSSRLPDVGRKPESRSEYDANRAMTKENYAIAAKQSQSFKTFRGGVKGKGTGSRRTQTNQVADHVKIYKESTND